MINSEVLEALADDGDTAELDDGRTLRLRIESDPSDVRDLWSDDCYGAVAWVEDRPRNDYGYPPDRPEGFDGNAEKLGIGRGYDRFWWQPPADVARGTEQFRALRTLVSDLLEFGFSNVGLEVLEGENAYHEAIVVNAAWLGGVEPWSYGEREVLDDILSQLLPELGLEVAS